MVCFFTGCEKNAVPVEKVAGETLVETPSDFSDVRWRAVWSQSYGDPKDTWLAGWGQRLCGRDSRDGGEHVILEGPGNFSRPLFSPDGETVIVSHRARGVEAPERSYQITAVGWDGAAQRVLGDGFACDTWRDPATGESRVLAAESVYDKGLIVFARRLVWFALDTPDERHLVWDSTHVTLNNAQISGDGKTLATTFPWPSGGLADVATGTWRKTKNGCWSGVSPDTSSLNWVFDGRHRNLQLTIPGEGSRLIRINSAPGVTGYEMYHPRWSNHPHFLTVTGPYKDGKGGNRLGFGGTGVEVYIGRLDEGLREVVAWEQVTNNSVADFFPDVWIEGGGGAQVDMAAVKITEGGRGKRDVKATELGDVWPGTDEGLLLVWKNAKSTNEVVGAGGRRRSFQAVARKGARFGRHYEMDVHGGFFEFNQPVGEYLAKRIGEQSEFTLEAVITPEVVTPESEEEHSVIWFGAESGQTNLSLSQKGDRLLARVRTMRTKNNPKKTTKIFGSVSQGEPHHILLTYREGQMDFYCDGEVITTRRGIYQNLGNWIPGDLVFGGGWNGKLEAIAIYDRFVGKEEAAGRYELANFFLGYRNPVEASLVRGRLVEAEDVPEIAALGGYRRHLSAHTYEITGGAMKGEKVIAYHWVILDQEKVPSFPRKVGDIYDLLLEPFEAHPQLASESMDAPDDLKLDEYLDITPVKL